MSDRKPTPDVLSNVLGGKGQSGRKPDAEAAKRHDVTPSKAAGKPFKLTSYIEEGLNDEVDDAVHVLKKGLGYKKLSKSILVEEALRICLSDPASSGLEAALRERNRNDQKY